MRLGVALHAEPLNVKLTRVISVMGLNSSPLSAMRARIWAFHLASNDGVLHRLPCEDLWAIALSGLLVVFADPLWMGAFPIQHSQSIAFAVVLAPFIASLLGTRWVGFLPRLRSRDGALLTAWSAALWVLLALMERLKRLSQLTRTATLGHVGIIIHRRKEVIRRVFAILACSLFLNTAAYAQVEIVAAVKGDLVSRHVDLSGPCGAFEITKRVAWALRSQGVGLLSKPSGNNCQGYSVDYLVRADASGVDILGDAGGDNGPGWSESEPPGAFVGRWREPFDPGDVVVVTPPATPQPLPAGDVPLSAIQAQIAAIAQQLAEHEAKEAAFRESVADQWKKFGVWMAKVAPFVVGGLLAGRATK